MKQCFHITECFPCQEKNFLKEMKIGFGMDRLPSGDFAASAAYFGIGMMPYTISSLPRSS
jgi:hypothetical protein